MALIVLPLLIVHAQTTTPEVTSPEATTTPSEEPAVKGQVLGMTTDSATAETITEPSTIETASSTEPVSSPMQIDTRTVFIQTGVKLDAHSQTGPITATINLQNLTCRDCETASPSVTIKVFYTEWFDNDGVDRVNATSTVRLAEQTFSVPSILPWQSTPVEWQTMIEAAGRYSFVVLIDPDNAIGAMDTFRTEFFVD